MSTSNTILVYGGSGALGKACVSHFIGKSFNVISIDLVENVNAQMNIVLKDSCLSWKDQESFIHKEMSNLLGDEKKLDGIFCVAGGWAGGNASDPEMINNAELMWRQSVWSSTIATTLAAKFLRPKGTLVLTGAMAAYHGPTPGMIGYGMAKAAVIQLTRSLGSEQSGLPSDAFVCCIMPETLDTPSNRHFMPNADFSSWTTLEEVTKQFEKWMEEDENRKSGALFTVLTRDNVTRFEEVA